MAVDDSLIPRYQVLVGETTPSDDVLLRAYGGPLDIRRDARRVVMNFVETVDGVIAYTDVAGTSTSVVAMKSPADRFLMALLRASADCVLIGAATMRADSRHQWTATTLVAPELRDEIRRFRHDVTGVDTPPPLAVVTASGNLPADHPALLEPVGDVLVLTTEDGLRNLPQTHERVRRVAVAAAAPLSMVAVLDAVEHHLGARTILCEGGPTLFGDLAAAHLFDELFLTLAPQLAGRSASAPRPALVEGTAFAPGDGVRLTLETLRRHGDHLFARYAAARD